MIINQKVHSYVKAENRLRNRNSMLNNIRTYLNKDNEQRKLLEVKYKAHLSDEKYLADQQQELASRPPIPIYEPARTKKITWSYADKTRLIRKFLEFLPDMGCKKSKPSFVRLVGPLRIKFFIDLRISHMHMVYYSTYCLTYVENFFVANLSLKPTYIMDDEQEYLKCAEILKQKTYVAVDGQVSLNDIFLGYERCY